MTTASNIYSIGHSVRSLAVFTQLLNVNSIGVLFDVRSTPKSKYHPHFNRQALHEALPIDYFWVGDHLGARRTDPNGLLIRLSYDYLKDEPAFQAACSRIVDAARDGKAPCFMCAEADPWVCHRFAYIARHLLARHDFDTLHILKDGSLQRHSELANGPKDVLFPSPFDYDALEADIYGRNSRKLAATA